jgi:hypothetical protein
MQWLGRPTLSSDSRSVNNPPNQGLVVNLTSGHRLA